MSETARQPAAAERGDPTATVIMSFFRNNWHLLAIGAALLSLLVLVYGLLQPRVYRASTTLIVSPARFASQLRPEALSVLGYQRVLESDEVVAGARRRLVDSGTATSELELVIGADLESRIFTGRRSEEKTLARVLEISARNHDADLAAAIANAWAESFLEAVTRLRTEQVKPALSVIEEQYEVEKTELEELTQTHLDEATGFEGRILEARNRWDQRLLQTELRWNGELEKRAAEGIDRIGAYQASTEARLGEVVAAWIEGRPTPAAGSSRDRLDELVYRILSLRTRLAQTPRLLSLESAGSEDAQWLAMVLETGSDSPTGSRLPEHRLVTERPNPVHAELILRLAEAEVSIDGLDGADRSRLQELLRQLEQAQRERSAGLEKLLAEQALRMHEARERKQLELRETERRRESEIATLRLQRTRRLAELDRVIGHQESAFDTLGGPLSEAQLARAERTVDDVRVAARAVPPSEPQPRGLAPRLVLSAVIGAFAGLLVGLIRNGRF